MRQDQKEYKRLAWEKRVEAYKQKLLDKINADPVIMRSTTSRIVADTTNDKVKEVILKEDV